MSISKIIDLKKQIVEVEEKIKEAENKISKIQLESKYNEEAHKFVNSFNFIENITKHPYHLRPRFITVKYK